MSKLWLRMYMKTSHVSFYCCKNDIQNCSRVYHCLSVSNLYLCIPLLHAQMLPWYKFLISLPPVFPTTTPQCFLLSILLIFFPLVYYFTFLFTFSLFHMWVSSFVSIHHSYERKVCACYIHSACKQTLPSTPTFVMIISKLLHKISITAVTKRSSQWDRKHKFLWHFNKPFKKFR